MADIHLWLSGSMARQAQAIPFTLVFWGQSTGALRIVVPSASLSITIKIVDLDERSYDAKAFKERKKAVGSCNKAHQWSAQIES